MDSSKNGWWIIPFKKFSRLRVKPLKLHSILHTCPSKLIKEIPILTLWFIFTLSLWWLAFKINSVLALVYANRYYFGTINVRNFTENLIELRDSKLNFFQDITSDFGNVLRTKHAFLYPILHKLSSKSDEMTTPQT